MTLRGASGAIVIRSAPRRIMSLSPSATEDLFAIGAARQVIAVDDHSNYPKAAPHTTISAYQPSLEAIAGYRPDLVVASDESPAGAIRGLRSLGVKVILAPAARSLDAAYAQIAELGLATGHRAEAGALVAHMRGEIAALARRVGSAGRGLSVYDEIGPDFYAASSRTFVGQILARFGLRNIADSAPDPAGLGYPKLSAERVLSTDPAIVLLSDTVCCAQNAATAARRPGWTQMRAVRDNTIVPVSDDIASRWGPRTVELASVVADAIIAARAATPGT